MNYHIEGANHNGHIGNNSLPIYSTFQEDLEGFKQLILFLEREKKGASFIHFGDGDYYFLKKIPIGSATPGRRALSIPYEHFDITPYREGWAKADYHCVEFLENGNRENLRELYPDQQVIATEFLYGLLMNKWFLRTFNGKIGLIGAGDKLDIIKELMNYKEYRNYLGIDKINDYIKVPQRFACDDLNETIRIVKEQLEKSTDETFIFLFGVGHVKSGLIHHLPKFKNAIYLDVGAGIDGLAGLIDPDRPYAGDWVNYRMRNYNYDNIDLLHYNIHNDSKLKWL